MSKGHEEILLQNYYIQLPDACGNMLSITKHDRIWIEAIVNYYFS